MSLSTEGSSRSANSVTIAAVIRAEARLAATCVPSIPLRSVRFQTGRPRGSL